MMTCISSYHVQTNMLDRWYGQARKVRRLKTRTGQIGLMAVIRKQEILLEKFSTWVYDNNKDFLS